MTTATPRERVRDARVARLATVSADGRPHLVPCCFVLSGDVVYSAVDDVKQKSSTALRRLDNVRVNAAVALLVDHYDDDDWSALWWVRLDGNARLLDDGPEREHALDALTAKYEQYAHARPPGTVLAVDVTGWRSWP